jgi:hypothetical protein
MKNILKSLKIIFLILLPVIINQNSTDCWEMYDNKTIDTPCVFNSSCCYVQYEFNSDIIKKCMLKLNSTDNICDNFEDILSYYNANIQVCDCSANEVYSLNIFVKFIIIILYVLI